MKNRILFYFIIISFFSVSSVKSQITISPEIGVSYLPFTFYTSHGEKIISKKPNFLLGISAQIPIHEKWDAKLRISYTDRNDIEWLEAIDSSGLSFFSEWKHQDLNIDLNFHYKLSENVSIGMGPSLLRTFIEFKQGSAENEFPRQKLNRFFFGLNSSISIDIKRATINLIYLRTHRFNGKSIAVAANGNNRFDLTIGYRIGKGK